MKQTADELMTCGFCYKWLGDHHRLEDCPRRETQKALYTDSEAIIDGKEYIEPGFTPEEQRARNSLRRDLKREFAQYFQQKENQDE